MAAQIRVGAVLALISILMVGRLVAGNTAPVAAQTPPSDLVNLPVTGTGTATNTADDTTQPVSFAGELAVRRFSARQEQVVVVGWLSGVFQDQAGTALAEISTEPVRVRAQQLTASCEALRLVLGQVNVDVTPATFEPQTPPPGFLQLDLETLQLVMEADEDDTDLARIVLCAVADLTSGRVNLQDSSALPLPAADFARLLTRAVRLLR